MKVVVQKCRDAKVCCDGQIYGQIKFGLLLLVAFTQGDTLNNIKWMAHKIAHLRIFNDEKGIMNLSVIDKKGSILSVSQFTLYADATQGNRPSYFKALTREQAEPLYEIFNKELTKYVPVEKGNYGEDMEVSFTNLGPTTILLER